MIIRKTTCKLMKRFFLLPVLMLLLTVMPCHGQKSLSDDCRKGIEALAEKKTSEAEAFFRKSISNNKDAESYYRLGKLQIEQNSFNSRNEALENLKQAALRKPSNLNFRLDYIRLLEDFASYSALSEYKNLIEEFPNCTAALNRLGEISLKGYNEYKNSRKIGNENDPSLDFDLADIAKTDFADAEKYFAAVIKIDPLNADAFYGLGRLYESAHESKKAEWFLKKIIDINPSNKNAHLFLGLIYHRMNNPEEASNEFGIALSLMTYNEREDFIYNSAFMIIKPLFNGDFKNITREEIEATIERFWKVSNPLLLSEYNSRLLEHYSRMAYANLYFSIPRQSIDGWKTDRGEVLLRYGEPKFRSKTRPYLSSDGVFSSKNDIWNFDEFILTFDDYNMDGNYKLSWDRGQGGRFSSSLRSNVASFESFEEIKRSTIQIYKPAGKTFDIDKEIFCFKDLTQAGKIDSYLAYRIPVFDSTGTILKNIPPYETGIFIYDRFFNPLFEKRSRLNGVKVKNIIADKLNSTKTDVIKFDLPADTVSFAFEMKNLTDSSFYSYHALTAGPKFKSNGIDLSDPILASEIESNVQIQGALVRGEISIVPYVKNVFKNKDKIFLYYEAYNLQKNTNSIAEFEQIITIREHKDTKNEGGILKFLNGIKDFIFGSGNQLSLSAAFSIKENNPQQYIQLDFSKYSPGVYDLILEVKDKTTGERIEKKMLFEIAGSNK